VYLWTVLQRVFHQVSVYFWDTLSSAFSEIVYPLSARGGSWASNPGARDPPSRGKKTCTHPSPVISGFTPWCLMNNGKLLACLQSRASLVTHTRPGLRVRSTTPQLCGGSRPERSTPRELACEGIPCSPISGL